MSPEASQPNPIEGRLSVLTERQQREYHEGLEVIFDPNNSGLGEYVGDFATAHLAVQQGILERMERDDKVYPLSVNFKTPEPVVLAAMEKRTEFIQEKFQFQELENAIHKSNGAYIEYEEPADLPDTEVSLVRASAHNHFGAATLKFDFFPENPRYVDSPALNHVPIPEVAYEIHINSLNKVKNPELQTDLPYILGMRINYQSSDDGYKDHIYLDFPTAVLDLLSGITKRMVANTMAKQFSDQIELRERTKQTLNTFADQVRKEVADPVEQRDILEKLGIYDDPTSP